MDFDAEEFPEEPRADNVPTEAEYAEEVAVLIASLGTQDKISGAFMKGESCLMALARLSHIVSEDDEKRRVIHHMLGELQVFQNALVPLFLAYHDNEHIAFNTVKLITAMTMPVKLGIDRYDVAIQNLQRYKEAMMKKPVLEYLLDMVAEGLATEAKERSEEQFICLELVLTLFRNVLAVPNPPQSLNNSMQHLHDRAMLEFSEEGIMEVLTVLASQAKEEEDSIVFLLLDLFYQYFRLEDGKTLTTPQTDQDSMNNLKNMLKNEKRAEKQRRQQGRNARLARFGGMLQRTGFGGKKVVSLQQDDNKLGNEAMYKRIGKKRQKKAKLKERRYMNDKVRQAGLKLATELLDGSWQPLIKCVLQKLFMLDDLGVCNVENQHAIHLAALLMEVHRTVERNKFYSLPKPKEGEPKREKDRWYNAAALSEIIDHDTINWVLARIETIMTNKKLKVFKEQAQFLPSAVNFYREIIRTLYTQLWYGNDDNRHNANVMMQRLFWESRPMTIIADLMRDYAPNEFPVDYLASVVTACYYMISMVERLTGGKKMVVKSKKKKKVKKPAAETMNEEFEGINIEGTGMAVDALAEQEEPEYEDTAIEFDFKNFLDKLASNKIIAQHMYLLENYKTNGKKLNGIIIYYFKRVRKDLELEPIFYQLSSFMLFNTILEDPHIKRDKQYDIVRNFALKILAGFFKRAAKDPTLFAELLFWKQRDTIQDILEPEKRQERKQQRIKKKYSKKSGAGGNYGFDMGFSSGEEEFELGGTSIAPWTPKEDEILREEWPKYKDSGCALSVMETFLDEQAGMQRTGKQIENRLVFLKLKRKAPKKRAPAKKGGGRRAPKRVVKPKLDDIEKPVFAQVAGLSSEGAPKEKKEAVDWLCDSLYKLSVSRDDYSRDKEDLAIIPIEEKEWAYLEDATVTSLMGLLNFQPPSLENGTAFWRVPHVYSAEDMDLAKELLEKGMDMPSAPAVNDAPAPEEPKAEGKEECAEEDPFADEPTALGSAVGGDSDSDDGGMLNLAELDAMAKNKKKRKKKAKTPTIAPEVEAAIEALAGKRMRINLGASGESPLPKRARADAADEMEEDPFGP